MDLVSNTDKKILLIDDEEDITDLIEDILLKEGFKNIRKANCGLDGIRICKSEKPDIVVLDIMLPDIDGIEVCKRIRQFSYCPILFLSAKNSDVDKIVGLSMGGDDYITKPFSPREIAFRIKAQLRRQQYDGIKEDSNSENENIIIGSITIDKLHSQVYKDGSEVKLTAKEYKLLLYLAENSNKIVNKERLCEVVWGDDYFGYDNTISVHIRHLREKLEKNPSKPEIIVTVIGLGYKLVKRNE
ncbi:response regulator transcription factor [Clostridium autoethanogenum]|uniref:Stage 0 sporulation protein A homolog n=1 Tax=Clostridium autoethanogenum DSM 10061 TaxID=1341692 RepID=A0ABM5NSB3_9CLOT|nr:response regulator transcription factor [Clostridium autoethanogenum]AGY75239.1 response regulator transcription factor [Clostridium autoethanogenum DSM 10061]ALU35408.1 Two component transcriptional regulator winged helix family [Clostridium autoethanogenum DSM 10061]OVY49513.1 Transcriptional regulatory protein YycF [Clostridium autoethanogenum]